MIMFVFILDVSGGCKLSCDATRDANRRLPKRKCLLAFQTSLALVRLLHIITTSHPVSGVFFCFPVSAISVFEVSCHRSPHCSCYSVAKTHYTATGARYRPRDERESVFIAQLLACVGELMSKPLAADVACLPNVL